MRTCCPAINTTMVSRVHWGLRASLQYFSALDYCVLEFFQGLLEGRLVDLRWLESIFTVLLRCSWHCASLYVNRIMVSIWPGCVLWYRCNDVMLHHISTQLRTCKKPSSNPYKPIKQSSALTQPRRNEAFLSKRPHLAPPWWEDEKVIIFLLSCLWWVRVRVFHSLLVNKMFLSTSWLVIASQATWTGIDMEIQVWACNSKA